MTSATCVSLITGAGDNDHRLPARQSATNGTREAALRRAIYQRWQRNNAPHNRPVLYPHAAVLGYGYAQRHAVQRFGGEISMIRKAPAAFQ